MNFYVIVADVWNKSAICRCLVTVLTMSNSYLKWCPPLLSTSVWFIEVLIAVVIIIIINTAVVIDSDSDNNSNNSCRNWYNACKEKRSLI